MRPNRCHRANLTKNFENEANESRGQRRPNQCFSHQCRNTLTCTKSSCLALLSSRSGRSSLQLQLCTWLMCITLVDKKEDKLYAGVMGRRGGSVSPGKVVCCVLTWETNVLMVRVNASSLAYASNRTKNAPAFCQ